MIIVAMINTDGMDDAYYGMRHREDTKRQIEELNKQFEKMNNHSKNIIKFEGELSLEGSKESGRIQGRIDMLKLVCEVFKIDIIKFE
jgi:hypothetical protein